MMVDSPQSGYVIECNYDQIAHHLALYHYDVMRGNKRH